MTIDWQKEVEARKDDLLKDLGDLIRINSIRDVEHGTKEEPLDLDQQPLYVKYQNLAIAMVS